MLRGAAVFAVMYTRKDVLLHWCNDTNTNWWNSN